MSSVVRFLHIDLVFSASNPPQLNFYREQGESPAACNFKRMNHEVGSHQKKDLDTAR